MNDVAEALASPPTTIEVVSLRVAEQLMSDMHRILADLEARLDATEQEAEEAERAALDADGNRSTVVEHAQHLLHQAEMLRGQGPAADAVRSPGETRGLRLLRAPDDPQPEDTDG